MSQPLLDCTVYTLVMACVGLMFAAASPTTDTEFIASLRAMQARLRRVLAAQARRERKGRAA